MLSSSYETTLWSIVQAIGLPAIEVWFGKWRRYSTTRAVSNRIHGTVKHSVNFIDPPPRSVAGPIMHRIDGMWRLFQHGKCRTDAKSQWDTTDTWQTVLKLTNGRAVSTTRGVLWLTRRVRQIMWMFSKLVTTWIRNTNNDSTKVFPVSTETPLVDQQHYTLHELFFCPNSKQIVRVTVCLLD